MTQGGYPIGSEQYEPHPGRDAFLSRLLFVDDLEVLFSVVKERDVLF